MRYILTTKDDLDNHFKISYSPVLTGYFAAVVPKNNPLAEKKVIYPNELKGQNIILLDNNWCPPEQLHLQEIIIKTTELKTSLNAVTLLLNETEEMKGLLQRELHVPFVSSDSVKPLLLKVKKGLILNANEFERELTLFE